MKPVYLLLSFTLLSIPPAASSQSVELPIVRGLENSGQFGKATAIIRATLTRDSLSLSPEEREHISFELDRLRRIRLDYPLTKDALFRQLKASVRDITTEEYELWIQEGRFDTRTIDDTLRFVATSKSNLFYRFPHLRARRIQSESDSTHAVTVLATTRAILKAAGDLGTPFVLPKRFRVEMTVTVDPDEVPAGDTIRAWLPVPRRFPHQKDFTLVASSSPVSHLSSEDSPIRSAYLEQVAVSRRPTVFRIQYDHTAYGVRFPMRPQDVTPLRTDDPMILRSVREAPHILFTDKIKRLSSMLVGSDTNPLTVAKKFYDWISENIRYSYAVEYSTIRNIGDYCLTKGYGDCGQEALLFMTLCRYNSIPARWQSGWYTMPGGQTIHDWTEIYLSPYGWVPVDPYMGIYAMQYSPGASTEERQLIRDFYFGGLDQYRIAANSEHCQSLEPKKRSLRSDTVDFQRGELESGSGNIYFDKYSYELTFKELSPGE